MHKICKYYFLLFALLLSAKGRTQSVTVGDANKVISIKSGIEYLEDTHHNFSPSHVFNNDDFKLLKDGIPNKNITSSAFWFKLKIRNETNTPTLILKLSNPELDSIDYYEQTGRDSFRIYRTGESMSFAHREYLSSDFLFSVHIPPHSEKLVYLRVSSSEALLLPLSAGTETAVFASDKYKDIFWGIYIGIMVAMLLYNFFVYVTTKDSSYFYYIIYVLAVVITQITISGFAFQLLWPNNSVIAKYSAFANPALVGLAAIVFIRRFLKTKTFLPNGHKLFTPFIILYLTGSLLAFAGFYKVGMNMIDIVAGILSLYVLGIGIVISRKGYRPAVFFLISWIVFLAGVFVFVFKNFGMLPYNNFTVYTMPVGSAMEVLLLSFALADRINILKKEKEHAQAKELIALHENEFIVIQQNVMLETKVQQRTNELELSNEELNNALEHLKDAQIQLVESEKMASLGQLTAGIAHEINNPVNFISANINPLNRDMALLMDTITEVEKIMAENVSVAEKQNKVAAYKDHIDFDYLKMEIGQSLHAIGEGASRTAEIVKGLRVFSRLDESDLKKADINEGLDSTLVITNNLLEKNIRLEKKYAKLPLIECYPGKLNQVFLNLIANAIHAIKRKFAAREGGVLTITTFADADNILIKIADNGCGMDEQTKKRIFEPFFTTKDVGEGVGLGLSISFNTVKQHNGQMKVTSEAGVGTEFTIQLPLTRE